MGIPRARDPDRITAGLEQCGNQIIRTGPTSWTLELRNGKAIPVRARLAGDWLRLGTPVEVEPAGEPSWRLLELNGAMPAGSRVILDSSRQPELQADVHLGDAGTEQTELSAVCEVLRDGCATLSWGVVAAIQPPASEPDSGAAADEPWALALAEAGWAMKRIGTDDIGLDFQARGSRHQIRIARIPAGLRFTAAITRTESPGPVARDALATMLLTASGRLRLVRAAGSEDERGAAARFEVLLGANPSDALADLAVGGLVLAVQQVGREARALVQESLAVQYLATISQGRVRCGTNREQALTCLK